MGNNLVSSQKLGEEVGRVCLPGHLSSLAALDRITSWHQRSATARCRIRPRPCLRQIPIAAVASDNTCKFKLRPKSRKTAWAPIPSLMPLVTAASSLSAVDRAKTGIVLHHPLMNLPPTMIVPPTVDFRVRRQPAQLASTNTLKLSPIRPQGYLIIIRGIVVKYRVTRLRV